METPARFSFPLDGSTTVFPIPVGMKGDNYIRIEVGGTFISDRNKFDLVNNAVVFVNASDVPAGSQLDVLVVQTDEGIANLGSVNSMEIVAAAITEVNTVATNVAGVISVADNMAEVLTADTNAATATAQAAIAVSAATSAATSETNAAASETAAELAEINAETAQTAAELAETNAESAEDGATAAQTAAELAETNAAASESAAATSETNAASSASAAFTSASNASTSETNAAASASAASTSETNAATSASNAAASETAAELAETNAQASKTAAELAETNAAASESAAATSETNAASSASAAEQSEINAAGHELVAGTYASNAASSATAASTSESNASSSATAASTSETNASTSETNAAASASAASTSASNAATSETNAASSATSAAASAASAAQSFDQFDDRYLGSKASDPTLDNDGDALVAGALYFNTVANEMRIYDGAAWIAASSATVETMDKYKFTATSGQTVFSGTDDDGNTLALTVGVEIVTLNGIVIEQGTDYTATSSAITLTVGATTDDELNVFAFGNFNVADTVSASTGGTFQDNIVVNGNVTATAFEGDGSGLTGLDADLLDGVDGSIYARKDQQNLWSLFQYTTITDKGTLTGTQTLALTNNHSKVTVGGSALTLNAPSSVPTGGAGVLLIQGASQAVNFNVYWDFGVDGVPDLSASAALWLITFIQVSGSKALCSAKEFS